MSVPGWIPGIVAFSALTRAIPNGHEGTYSDSGNFGLARNILVKSRGTGEAELQASPGNFTVTLRKVNVGDVILVDRIS